MTAMRVIRTILFAVGLAFVAAPAGADDANPAASSFMQSLGSKAIHELTDPGVPQAERQARFRALLDGHFDIPAIAKFTLGRYWRTATEEQRTDFIQLFEDFRVSLSEACFQLPGSCTRYSSPFEEQHMCCPFDLLVVEFGLVFYFARTRASFVIGIGKLSGDPSG